MLGIDWEKAVEDGEDDSILAFADWLEEMSPNGDIDDILAAVRLMPETAARIRDAVASEHSQPQTVFIHTNGDAAVGETRFTVDATVVALIKKAAHFGRYFVAYPAFVWFAASTGLVYRFGYTVLEFRVRPRGTPRR